MYYLADRENKKMLQALKRKQLEINGLTQVTRFNMHDFSNEVIDIIMDEMRSKKKQILDSQKQFKYENIMRAIDYTHNDIYMKTRLRPIVIARQLFMFVLDKYNPNPREYSYSLKEIGKILSKDHATVIHAVKQIRSIIEMGKSFQPYHEIIDNTLKRVAIKWIKMD